VYRKLPTGRHTLRARALDAAGNADSSPALRRWSVKRRPRYHPRRYEILTGRLNAGGVRQLRRDDGKRLEIDAVPRSGAFRAEIELISSIRRKQLASLQKLTLEHDGGVSTRAAITVRIFNVRTRHWVKVLERRKARRDRRFRWSRAASADDYVARDGSVRTRVSGKGRKAFRTQTDLVRLTIEY
jgi:hypothetical protein